MDDYEDIYRINAFDEWINGAYTEKGEAALCDRCGGEMKWNPVMRWWYCRKCGQEMIRPVYFNHIGADPPDPTCLTGCDENYPLCKKTCEVYPIDPEDPMMD